MLTRKQGLIVVDGTIGMDEDQSPSRGNPVEPGVLVAGQGRCRH